MNESRDNSSQHLSKSKCKYTHIYMVKGVHFEMYKSLKAPSQKGDTNVRDAPLQLNIPGLTTPLLPSISKQTWQLNIIVFQHDMH